MTFRRGRREKRRVFCRKCAKAYNDKHPNRQKENWERLPQAKLAQYEAIHLPEHHKNNRATRQRLTRETNEQLRLSATEASRAADDAAIQNYRRQVEEDGEIYRRRALQEVTRLLLLYRLTMRARRWEKEGFLCPKLLPICSLARRYGQSPTCGPQAGRACVRPVADSSSRAWHG